MREVTPTPPGKISAVQAILPKVAGSVKGAYWSSVDTTKSLGIGAWHLIASALNSTRNTITTLADGVHRYKQFADASNQATNAFLASTYTAIAHQAPGIVGDGLVALGNGFSRASNTVARSISGTGSSIASYVSAAANPLVSNTGKTAHHLKVNLLATGEIWFDRNPTNITDVQVTEVGRDYAVITWKTTHYTTNNKVNYGETLSYGHDALDLERERLHRITIKPLKPETKYYFEVMSQNKNYVYDAHHEFTTGSGE